jgi:hypothetical protein
MSPGVVGSVGDGLTYTKLQTSSPDQLSYRKPLSNTGSNVQDGYSSSYTSGGGGASVLRKSFGYREHFRSRVGWIKEDLRPGFSPVQPTQLDRQGVWQERAARIYKAGEKKVLELPGGYVPERMTRGSQIPRIIEQGATSNVYDIPLTNVVERVPIIPVE